LLLALAVGVVLAACRAAALPMERPAGGPTGKATHEVTQVAQVAGHDHPMAGLNLLPPDMRHLPARTEEAYLFSVVNPDVARAIPCYCGCVGLGHLSSYDCYVAEVRPNGAFVFDTHALNCLVCVDITQDAMRLLDEGSDLPEIRTVIDRTYAPYGPPTPLHAPTARSPRVLPL
jgi:hypothetical protein